MIAASACPECGAGLVASDRFCGRCGTGIVRCTTCTGIGVAGDRFCSVCGRDFPTGDDAPSAVAPDIKVASPRPASSPWDGVVQRLREATLGEYEVVREIGRGGMAAVFLAHEIALNRKVAIKVMSPGVMLSNDLVERFRQEAVTVANLTHSNIVTVHAVRAVDDLHFFIMEFIAGRPLDKVLEKVGRLPIPVVRAILSQVGSALAYAHRRGVIHRDVKPGNIILDADGQAIVTDFGIAKVMTAPTTTQTGAVHGTAAYMSPEQCYASALTPASDQYSLGVVAYEMLAGRAPFSGDSSFALMQSHTSAPVPTLTPHRDDCPPDLEAAVLRMMAKKPNERWPGITAALSALQAFPIPPDDPVLDELVRLADVEAARSVGEVLRTPVSPVPVVARRTPGRVPTTAERTTVPSPPPVAPPVVVPARTLRLEPAVVSMEVGDSVTARATVLGGVPLSPLETVTWSTSTADLVRVDRLTGVISAEAPGTASVTAAIGDVQSSILVTIVPAAVVAVPSETRRRAPVSGPGTRRRRLPPVWAMGAGVVALLGVGALMLSQGVGQSAREEGPVRPPPSIRTIVLSPPPAVVRVGDAFALTADVRGGDSTAAVATRWRSLTPSVVVDSMSGEVAALAAGRAEVVAYSGAAQDTATFDVLAVVARGGPDSARTVSRRDPPRADSTRVVRTFPVRDVVISGLGQLESGQSVQLQAVVRDTRGAVVSDAAVSWSSDNQSVVQIDAAAGRVQAGGPGQAIVTATVGSVTAMKPMVVMKKPDVVVEKPKDPPPPPATPTAEERLRARESQIKGEVESYARDLGARNVDRVRSLYRPVSEEDIRNVARLAELMKTNAFAVVRASVGAPRLESGQVVVDLATTLRWRSFAGANSERGVVFRAVFEASGAEWRLVTCRIVGNPRLT